jgi:excisionase family DNA binding protein
MEVQVPTNRMDSAADALQKEADALPKKAYTINHTAALLDIKRSTVYKWLRNGKLKSILFEKGKKGQRVTAESIDKLLKE